MLQRRRFSLDELVNTMLDALPAEIWTSSTTTFLDPSIGGGQFVVAIERRLAAAGHSIENIKNRVFGYEANKLRIRATVGRLKLKGTYTKSDFINDDINMKFDVIIGNPPYQSTEDGSKRKKMWVEFANKALDTSDIVAFVTPTAWQKSNNKYFTEVAAKISNNMIAYGDANDYFKVGEDVGYWIVDRNATETVELVDDNPCAPIYNKMLRTTDKWHYRDFQQPHNNKREYFPKAIEGEFTMPIYWTAKQVRYCRPSEAKYNGWKVIVNNSGHFHSVTDPKKYSRVDNTMTVGLGAWGIKVDSKDAGERVLSWVRSKAYRVVVTKMKTGGFNNPFIELESLGSDKYWTDEEIYKHFNLTQDEINYIEENA